MNNEQIEALARKEAIDHVNKIWEDTKFLLFERDGCMNHFMAGFKAGYTASKSTSEEEKDLWLDLAQDILYDGHDSEEGINKLKLKYKISKR